MSGDVTDFERAAGLAGLLCHFLEDVLQLLLHVFHQGLDLLLDAASQRFDVLHVGSSSSVNLFLELRCQGFQLGFFGFQEGPVG